MTTKQKNKDGNATILCFGENLNASFHLSKLILLMGVVITLLVKIAFKTYLSSLSRILTMANLKQTVYMCKNAPVVASFGCCKAETPSQLTQYVYLGLPLTCLCH